MVRPLLAICILSLFASAGWTQDKKEDVVTELAVADFEKFLQTFWKKDKLDKTEYKSRYRYKFNDDQWIDFYHGKEGGSKFLLVQMIYPKDRFNKNITLEMLNDWNVAAVYSRAYFHKAGKDYAGVTLEGTLPLDGGVSSRQFAAFVTQLDKEFQRFVPALGGLKAAPQNEEGAAPRRERASPDAAPHFTAAELVQGQEVAKELSPDDLERDIKAFLKVDKIDKTDFKDFYRYQIDEHLRIDYYLGKGDGRKFILYQFTWPKTKFQKEVTLEMLNDWNIDAVYTRAYFTRGKDKTYATVVLEATLALDAGIGTKQLDAVTKQFGNEFKRFVPAMGGLTDGKERTGKEKPPLPAGPVERVRQGFPAAKADNADLTKNRSGWDIEWDYAPVGTQTVFRIVRATFHWRDAKGEPRSLVVLRNLQLVEAFTQYDDRQTCFLDIAKVGLRHVPGSTKFLGPFCVGPGEVLKSNNALHDNKVHKELHYDGLRWVSIYGSDPPAGKTEYQAHRGEKLVLWAGIASGNYVYLMEYNFADDGRIVTRLGFTAHNFFDRAKLPNRRTPYGSRPEGSGGDVHPHIGCWRFDVEMHDATKNEGGPKTNKIQLVRRVFENSKFRQDLQPFPGNNNAAAMEGKASGSRKSSRHCVWKARP